MLDGARGNLVSKRLVYGLEDSGFEIRLEQEIFFLLQTRPDQPLRL
jgi:hypothetical protein